MLNVEPQGDGGYTVRLPPAALEFLHRLPEKLRALLKDPDFGDAAVRRLFPIAYKDPKKEAEYRRLVADDLVRRKLAALDVFDEILSKCQMNLAQASITIPPEHFHGCLGVINDTRLVLGVELDLREDLWEREFDSGDPESEKLLLLHFLSYLEEALLEATGMVDLKIRPEDVG